MGLVGARLGEVQLALRDAGVEGWLLYDYRGQNPVARRALALAGPPALERWFCWVPAEGMPALIVHEVDEPLLGEQAFDVLRYAGWTALRAQLERTLPRRGAVAMESQRIAGQPALSRVDEGTAELVRSYGPRVVSSGALVDALLSPWTSADEVAHAEAHEKVRAATSAALEALCATPSTSERDWLAQVHDGLTARALELPQPPRLTHALAPFRATGEAQPLLPETIYELLIVARVPTAFAPLVHHRVLLCRGAPNAGQQRAFAEARSLRDAAITFLVERLGRGSRVLGFEVDEHVRTHLARLATPARMPHRTGHHLGWDAYSAVGCTFDSLDVHDTRALRDRHAVALHPGVYREGIGVRASASVMREGDALRILDAGQDEVHRIPA